MKHGTTSNCICVGVDFSLSSGLREEICQNVVSKMPDLLYARKIREAGSQASVVLRQLAARVLKWVQLPNGRLLDHFRVATGGSEIFEAAFELTDISSNPELKGVFALYHFWGRDANLRRSMTTSTWLDLQGARGIGARFLKLSPASAVSPILTKFLQYTHHPTCYSIPVSIYRQD